MLNNAALRIFAASALAALAAGCVAVPGDAYYESSTYYPPTSSSVTVYEQPGYVYSNPRVYPVPYPVYTPVPPPPRYGWQRDRNDWRDRRGPDTWQRDADRREADRRDADRRRNADRQRDQADRDRRAQAQAQQDRDRRAQQDRDRQAQQERDRSNPQPARPIPRWNPRPEFRMN